MPSAVDLGVEDVLEVLTSIFQLEGEVRRNELRILCPVHEVSGSHKPSCDVNLTTGHWNCFSCQASGDLVKLGVIVLGADEDPKLKGRELREWRESARERITKLLAPSEPSAMNAAIQARTRKHRKEMNPSGTDLRDDENREKRRSGRNTVPLVYHYKVRFPNDLRVRGFTAEQCAKWNIRYVKKETFRRVDGDGEFQIEHAIAIPVINEKGKVVVWCYRATEKSPRWFQEMRYLYTPGLKDSIAKVWFGIDQHGDKDHVAVTEGALDAIWLDQCGIPAIAILGSNVKEFAKLDRLASFRKVTLFTDRDKTGIEIAEHLGGYLLQRGVPVTIARYPRWAVTVEGKQAKDPNQLGPLDVELMWHRAVPFQTWRLANR